jgi:hypothetical protein
MGTRGDGSNQSWVVERLEVTSESGTRVLENCVVFQWQKHEHFSGDEQCSGCCVPALVCSRDGGLLHTGDSHMDEDGCLCLETQCDRELPDDPADYGVNDPGSLGIRLPSENQPPLDHLMTEGARLARPTFEN